MNVLNYFKSFISPYKTFEKNAPLVSKEKKIALFWSPKTGCTFTTKWFFSQTGHLESALKYHKFVHKYRIQVYQKSIEHKESLKDLIRHPESYRILKIVRDPYLRAVSSYIHTNKNRFSDQVISDFLKRKVDETNRFSFSEFIHYLETVNINECDPHYKAQTHTLELHKGITPTFTINLPNSVDELSQLELKLNLNQTKIGSFIHSSHHTIRQDSNEFVGTKIFPIIDNDKYPEANNFYNDKLKLMVHNIYKEDFNRYSDFF